MDDLDCREADIQRDVIILTGKPDVYKNGSAVVESSSKTGGSE